MAAPGDSGMNRKSVAGILLTVVPGVTHCNTTGDRKNISSVSALRITSHIGMLAFRKAHIMLKRIVSKSLEGPIPALAALDSSALAVALAPDCQIMLAGNMKAASVTPWPSPNDVSPSGEPTSLCEHILLAPSASGVDVLRGMANRPHGEWNSLSIAGAGDSEDPDGAMAPSGAAGEDPDGAPGAGEAKEESADLQSPDDIILSAAVALLEKFVSPDDPRALLATWFRVLFADHEDLFVSSSEADDSPPEPAHYTFLTSLPPLFELLVDAIDLESSTLTELSLFHGFSKLVAIITRSGCPPISPQADMQSQE
eukprot:m.266111 g.266111  ORF g.266111 m.266111 type:complete len:312 (+) comp30863_c0_seq1:25-960(+)